jgi:beta-catenin-like protein 1
VQRVTLLLSAFLLLSAAAAVGRVQVAADPNTLYPLLIDSPAVATLAGLLSHDNTDIAVEVMDLLQELTDAGEEGSSKMWFRVAL